MLPPGSSSLTLPLNRRIVDGTSPENSPTEGTRYTLPPPGPLHYELWAQNVTSTASDDPAPLDPAASVTVVGRDASIVDVVGAWNCTYYIAEHALACVDPEGVATGITTNADRTFSGTYSSPTSAYRCENNACAQCFGAMKGSNPGTPVEGPIPKGTYAIGQGFLDPTRKFMSYRLAKLETVCERFGSTITNGNMNPTCKWLNP